MAAGPVAQSDAAATPAEEWVCGPNASPGEVQVRSIANGRVALVLEPVEQWGRTVVVEHTVYENERRLSVWSLYGRLSAVSVRTGDEVRTGQTIGIAGSGTEGGAGLHFELRRDESVPATWWNAAAGRDRAWIDARYLRPGDFIRAHREAPVPQREEVLVLVDQARYKMRVCRFGQPLAEYDVSVGQGHGQKRVQGDNRTPRGMYFVVDKRRGSFPGAYGAYYGGHWIKINYPNKFDAERGVAEGAITPAVAARIGAEWERRRPTDEATRLGGGIGFHGWVREWTDTGPRHLSWGCVVVHLRDIASVYNQVPRGAMVVIF